MKIQQLFPPTFLNHASPSLLPLRALNEMWKCQNMLRGLVKELLDLHKLPVVCGCKHITETFTYIISNTRLMYTMLFSASAVWGQQHGHVWEANEYCQWVKALSSISPHASWCVLIFLWKFSACQDSLFDCLYIQRTCQMLERHRTSWRNSTKFLVRTRSSVCSWRCSSARLAPANRPRSVWWVAFFSRFHF